MKPANRPVVSLRGFSLDRRSAAGDVPVLRDLDLDLMPGRWLAVLGANGAGKSSLLKYLAAAEAPVAGRAAILFQDPEEQIVATSVDRELALGRPGCDAAGLRSEFGLGAAGGLDPRLLSAGRKQRLALAVALGGAPDLLLCDEPTSLQDPQQARWVLDRLDRWRHESGGALVTATCDPDEAARADDLLLLADGRAVVAGPRGDVQDDPRVRAVLDRPGGSPARPASAGRPADGAPVLELAGVACAFAGGGGFAGVDLAVRRGERLGLLGENGCGKSTLLAVAAGARRPAAGVVTLAGRRLYRRGDTDLDHGAALLAPQFPEYLFTRATVAAEMGLDPALADRDLGPFLGELGLPVDLEHRNPHDLSSGQKRRLALGLVLGSARPLLLLDEPTAALDAAGRECVLALLDGLPPQAAVVVASHDRHFLARAGCRLLVLGPGGLVPVP